MAYWRVRTFCTGFERIGMQRNELGKNTGGLGHECFLKKITHEIRDPPSIGGRDATRGPRWQSKVEKVGRDWVGASGRSGPPFLMGRDTTGLGPDGNRCGALKAGGAKKGPIAGGGDPFFT